MATAALLALLASCNQGLTDPAPGALRVLFIGNSLTYHNNLPRTIAGLSASAGFTPCYCIAVAYPDFALLDHWLQGDAADVLEEQEFDFVVMQQGSSALPLSRDILVQYATLFAGLIRQNGATPVMYSVWPSDSRMFDFLAVGDSYRAAAEAINGIMAPAGGAWLAAWEQDATLPLYDQDGLHPSRMGTYLAALVLFERLYERSPVGVQTQARVDGSVMNWSPATVQLLQEAAATALSREPR